MATHPSHDANSAASGVPSRGPPSFGAPSSSAGVVVVVGARGLGPSGHDVALLRPHPASARAGTAAAPTHGGPARLATHERPTGGLHGRDVGARVPVLLVRALPDHRAREVSGALDPDGGVGIGEAAARRAHELARRVQVVVVERDELAGVAVGLAGEQDPAAVGMVPLERARHGDGRVFARDTCEPGAVSALPMMLRLFQRSNGKTFGHPISFELQQQIPEKFCGFDAQRVAAGEMEGAMTTDGDPRGLPNDNVEGISEGQILSMEVRPATRPSATSTPIFPTQRQTIFDNAPTLPSHRLTPTLQGDELAAHDNLEEALDRYDRALLADRKQHGDAHPDVAARYCSIGGLYKATGDNEMAREYFAKALEVEESTGTDGRRTARASYMSNLAAVSRAAGDVDLARDQYCTALDHLRGMIPDSNEAVETALSRRKPVCFATAATRGRRVHHRRRGRRGAVSEALGRGRRPERRQRRS